MDSKAEPADNVRRAIERGLAGLTFTEHFDTHPDDWPLCVYDEGAYAATIRDLRAEFGSNIFIGKGIEVCYQPQNLEWIAEVVERGKFDLVLFSIHYYPTSALHVRESYDPRTLEFATRSYLQHVLQAVEWVERLHRRRRQRLFHVLSHLDLVKRYTQRFFHAYDVAPCSELIDRILTTCLEAGLVPEINTSSLRQGLAECMPGPATVRRYAELGGTAMSLGSDSHKAADIGAGFDTATEMLRDAGIRQIAVFEQREMRTVTFDAPAG
jgi:histidinol-phosphatase (PHP family)